MSLLPQNQVFDSDDHFRTDHLKNDLGRKSARSGALTLSSQALKFTLGIGSTVILARLLTPADYGVVGMVAIILNFAQMFQYLGLSIATVQAPALNHKQVSTLFWVNVGLSTLIALVMMGMSPFISWFFQEPRVILVTIGYAVSVFITGWWIQHQALLNRQMRFGVLTLVDIASSLIGLATAVISALYGAGYWALVYNQLATTLVQLFGYWIACTWRPGIPGRPSSVRSLLLFGGHFTGTNLMNFISRNLDNLLIGKYWGAQQLGLYSRSYQLLLLPLEQISTPIGLVAIPALSRLADTPQEYRKAYLGLIEKIAMVTMPCIALMCSVSDWLVLFVLGPQWTETGRIFMFLGASAAVQPITRTCFWLFSTQGRTRDMFRWSIVTAIIAILSICAGLSWGAVGVAASYAAADICIHTPLLLWFVGREGPVRTIDFYKTLFTPTCASACVLVVLIISRSWLAELNLPITRLIAASALAAFTTLAVYACLPTGRKAMKNFTEVLRLTMRRREPESAHVD